MLAGKHAIIETRGLTKRYGAFAALDECTLKVDQREIFGLLGPNGAGKTTLLRLLLGFLHPTSGWARLHGRDCSRESLAIRRLTAYLPGEARLFRGMRGRDILRFFAEMRRVPPAQSLQVAEQLELNINARVGTMSTGMRQKLAIAATFAAPVQLMILDEPTANLDPTARSVVLQLVREARKAGSTIVFSSHVLAEVEELCDRVAILRAGQVVHEQAMHELRRQHRILARLKGQLPPAPALIQSSIEVQPNEDGWVAVHAHGELAPVLGWLGTLPLQEVRIDPVGLHTIYHRFHGNRAISGLQLQSVDES